MACCRTGKALARMGEAGRAHVLQRFHHRARGRSHRGGLPRSSGATRLALAFLRRARLVLDRYRDGAHAGGVFRAARRPAGRDCAASGSRSSAMRGRWRTRTHGEDIDEADLVVRINRAPRPSALSHGTRTDWLALATSLDRRKARSIGARRILWMSPQAQAAAALGAGYRRLLSASGRRIRVSARSLGRAANDRADDDRHGCGIRGSRDRPLRIRFLRQPVADWQPQRGRCAS